MKIDGRHIQSIWYEPESDKVCIIDQTRLPHRLEIIRLQSLDETCHAIRAMQVRGAPLIGVTAAYGVYLALRENPDTLSGAMEALAATRPTAVNLRWALDRMKQSLADTPAAERAGKALATARLLEQEDIAVCRAIGRHGLPVLEALWREKSRGGDGNKDSLNVLTHCNAGALATVDRGTALAVLYEAHEAGIPLHVWVSETRPRNQGAALSCWELSGQGVPNTLVVDNAGGHLMQTGQVDLCLVGSDRTTLGGDVCNKIGTYPKALAAHHNRIPFYAALPVSTIDFSMDSGLESIPIEQRGAEEVSHSSGMTAAGAMEQVRLAPAAAMVSNPAFDVTPAEFITGIITERGFSRPAGESLRRLLD